MKYYGITTDDIKRLNLKPNIWYRLIYDGTLIKVYRGKRLLKTVVAKEENNNEH